MPRIVSISSFKGGAGKTSITLGLASAALHSGLSTLVIDLDPTVTPAPVWQWMKPSPTSPL